MYKKKQLWLYTTRVSRKCIQKNLGDDTEQKNGFEYSVVLITSSRRYNNKKVRKMTHFWVCINLKKKGV